MFIIYGKLKPNKTIRDVAAEIQAMNQLVGTLGINPETGEDYFPRPIKCDPNAATLENCIGDGVTIPDQYGRFAVQISDVDYIDWSVLPMQPQTFTVISGNKPFSTGNFA